MRYGLINNEKVEATEKGQRSICPCCNTELLSKCGEFKVNHWAHVNLVECDSWQGKKTDWHIDWQDQFPKEFQEVIYTDYKTGEKHIADVSYNDFIFEFQHSGIKFEEIVKRTNFYQGIGKKVVWIFDYTEKEDNFSFYHWKLSNVSRIKEWKYKPKHISIMQDWDTLTLIDVGYELRLLLCDSLSIKIDNIKEIATPEFRTKLFNLQKYFDKDILEKQSRTNNSIMQFNNYYDKTDYEGDQEIFKMEEKLQEAINDKNEWHMHYLEEKKRADDYANTLSNWQKSMSEARKLIDSLQYDNAILNKKLSANTNLFSYS